MKIIYLGIGYPIKGEQNIYTDLVKTFVEHGHKVTVVCSDTTIGKQRFVREKEGGADVLRIQTGDVVGNVSVIKKGFITLMIDQIFLRIIKSFSVCFSILF